MRTQFTHQGVWWLPETPEEQVTGNLTFSPDEGGTLDLIGSLKNERKFGIATAPEIILGLTVSGKPVTLYQCYEKDTTLSSGGMMKTDYIITVIFVGHHFRDAESMLFNHMYFRFAYLEEWLDMPTFDKKFGKYVWSIKYRKPKRVKLLSTDNYGITLATAAQIKSDVISATIENKYSIGVIFKQDRPFGEFIDIMTKLQNLISLCVLRTAPPVEIDGRTTAASYMLGRKRRYTSIKICYQLPLPANIGQNVRTDDMLFSFQDISKRANVIIQNWLQKTEMLRPMYSLYFGTIHNTKMYAEHEFLSLMQALEYYHRATMPELELPENEHNERILQIINAHLKSTRNG
jgi:ApeA N-terminal domain 1